MTMKRIEVPWTPACEREETALPRTGPAKMKLKGNPHGGTHKRSSREAQGKPKRRHIHTQTKFKGSSRKTCIEAHNTLANKVKGKHKGNPH